MKRMLFNATQAEELRVAIVDGQKLIDLDIESATKEQRKSNIYKAVITRIEPSLEAAFVDYGNERHGFLPFKEVSRVYFKSDVEPSKARIQDALAVGQELIVQVEKDERGNKGAALTTFISLAGRYLVLMPNNPRGGGVSRRVEGEDRQELREVMDQLEVPGGMSLIARTAGIGRNAEELQWDLNYLLQLWRAIESAANSQSGAFLIYQESSLVIRAIRDYYQPDIGEILIDTDDVFEQATQFMSHVMPSTVSRVKRYHDDVPLFSRFQIEHQIESAYSRQVNLPSGGAIVMDHTEALVAVDVNSGRATKGSDIEETAFRTNLEAADEIARQLRLRDLGGLIVIDFIDMESTKNQREVENRLRDALHHDRARVQTGKISRFGLLELSRQRLRPALAETSYITCPRCTGTGHIRSTESAALHILRILEEEAMKENTGALHLQVPVDVATFLLNEKRVDIARIEVRHRINLLIVPNRHLETPAHEITRLRHDQLNQEGISQPSYRMADEQLSVSYQPPSAQTDARPAKPEAAVKGITPGQAPAPIVEARQPAPAPKEESPGLFGRLFGWLSNDRPAASEPVVVAEKAPTKSSSSSRSHSSRDRRSRSSSSGRSDNASNSSNKSERKEQSDSRQSQSKRDDQSSRNKPQASEQRNTQPKEKTPKSNEPKQSTSQNTASANPANGQPAGESSSSRRRSRRGGRGRGSDRKQENAPSGAQAELVLTDGVGASTPPSAHQETVSQQTVDNIIAPAPIDMEEIRPVETAPVAVETPRPVVETAPAPAAVAVVETAPKIEPATMPESAVSMAPPPAPSPTPAAPAPKPLDLSSAGLVMIETTNNAQFTPVEEPAQPLGRKPRPVASVPDEPLQMVETRNN